MESTSNGRSEETGRNGRRQRDERLSRLRLREKTRERDKARESSVKGSCQTDRDSDERDSPLQLRFGKQGTTIPLACVVVLNVSLLA